MVEKNNDAINEAVLAIREGRATVDQNHLFQNFCEKKAEYFANKFNGIINESDLLGDALAKIWEKIDEFNPDKASFSTWSDFKFKQICSGMYGRYTTRKAYGEHSLDGHLKMEESGVCIYDFIEDEKSPSPEDEAIYSEMEQTLYKYIDRLSLCQAKAVEAVYLKGMKSQEAAKYLNCSADKIYNDTYRGIQKIRTLMEDAGIERKDVISYLSK